MNFMSDMFCLHFTPDFTPANLADPLSSPRVRTRTDALCQETAERGKKREGSDGPGGKKWGHCLMSGASPGLSLVRQMFTMPLIGWFWVSSELPWSQV